MTFFVLKPASESSSEFTTTIWASVSNRWDLSNLDFHFEWTKTGTLTYYLVFVNLGIPSTFYFGLKLDWVLLRIFWVDYNG